MKQKSSRRRAVATRATRTTSGAASNARAGARRTLKRRDFLGLLGAASLAPALSRLAQAAPTSNRAKPNLLFIWTDQERKDLLRVYGNKKVRADNLNKLTEESFVMMDPYISQPICTSSR